MKSRQLEPPCLTCKTIISNFKLKPSSSSNFELAKLFENSAKRAWVDYEKKVFFKYLHIFNLLRICRSRKILEIGIQNLRTSCSKTGDEREPTSSSLFRFVKSSTFIKTTKTFWIRKNLTICLHRKIRTSPKPLSLTYYSKLYKHQQILLWHLKRNVMEKLLQT